MNRAAASPGVGTSAWLVSVLPLLAAVLYAAWLGESLLDLGLSRSRSYVSELGAQGRPFAAVFRATDAAAGLLLGVWAVLRMRARHRWPVRLGWSALLTFALATVADAAFPLSCPPTQDASCRAREAAGQLPWTHQVHTVTSTLAGTALLVAVLLLTAWVSAPVAGQRPAWTAPDWTAPDWSAPGWVRRVLVASAVVYLAGTVWTLGEVARFTSDPAGPSLLGAAQRVQLAAAAGWIACLGAGLRGAGVAPPGTGDD